MKLIPDNTGRFPQRPHFDEGELDGECERLVAEVCGTTTAKIPLPISTDFLTKLIERHAEDLDLYADLSEFGPGVHGVTVFVPGERPGVKIAREVSEHRNQNRLRTTLTHEFGHVRYHDWLYQMNQPRLFGRAPSESHQCHRNTILDSGAPDWMEWQAGYVCGSILMPATHMTRVATVARTNATWDGPIGDGSPEARALAELVAQQFAVSEEAARVRLLKLGLVQSQSGPRFQSLR